MRYSRHSVQWSVIPSYMLGKDKPVALYVYRPCSRYSAVYMANRYSSSIYRWKLLILLKEILYGLLRLKLDPFTHLGHYFVA